VGKRFRFSHKINQLNKLHDEAWQRLNRDEYIGIVKDTGFGDIVSEAETIIASQMRLVSFDEDEDRYETVCFVKGSTDLYIVKHSHDGIFMGYNLYTRPEGETNLILLEGYNDEESARNVMEDIKSGLGLGVEYYRLPDNCGEDEDDEGEDGDE